jgi:hypothetical protein
MNRAAGDPLDRRRLFGCPHYVAFFLGAGDSMIQTLGAS